MPINSRKALFLLALAASCGVAVMPKSASAADLERIVVVGSKPQSQGEIDAILSQFRQQSTWQAMLPEYEGLVDVVDGSESSLTTYDFDGCTNSQDARTSRVTQALTLPIPRTSTSFPVGERIRVTYMNGRSWEYFVVTGLVQSNNPNVPSQRTITPVAGSFYCQQ